MDLILETVLLVVLLPMAAMTGLLFVQATAAVVKATRMKRSRTARPSIAVLVPAHDEAEGIKDTLMSIQSQLEDGDRLLVVADNCTDATADVAIACGALVCVRHDTEKRAKGYALDHGIRFLSASPPQVVIVVDADCHVGEGAINILARQASATGCPAQALYMMLPPFGAGIMGRIAGFAWAVRNRVRPLGCHRLGLPCQLMGSGMAFPWGMISTAGLANGNLVEDIVLGIELAERGAAPKFCPDALVTSFFPRSKEGLKSQRYRWEHGHLAVLLKTAPAVLWRGIRMRNLALAALALDLMVPPLALFLLALGAVWAVAAFSYFWHGAALPFAIATVLLCLMGGTLLLSWWKFGRQQLSLWDLCLGIGYLLWKIPVYLRFLLQRQVHWIKSARH
ncbi:glycosyltransferase family 2 protein [Massilia sp. TN1-12]|uniref:glycosyltransferase family 2 protein n=1 Tax=Massilia paldalensis TaxID=3377675 RepID=UPI00384E5345